MADEQAEESGANTGDDAEQSEIAAAASKVGSEISETFSELKGGERLAVIGAAIVLVVWLVFDLLIDDYSTGALPFALALLIVGAAFVHHRRDGADPVPYGSLLFVAAGILGIIGAVDAIEEIRDDIFDARGGTVVGALGYYAGAIVSGVGALQLRGK